MTLLGELGLNNTSMLNTIDILSVYIWFLDLNYELKVIMFVYL